MYLFLLIVSVVFDSPLVVFFVEVIFVKNKHTQTSNLVWVFLCWIDIFLEKTYTCVKFGTSMIFENGQCHK